MATQSKVLEIINSLRLRHFGSPTFKSKHEVSEEKYESKGKGYIKASGRTQAVFSEETEQIKLYIRVELEAFEDGQKEAAYTFEGDYIAEFEFNNKKHLKDFQTSELEVTGLMPVLSSIAWPLVRRHLIGSLENAGYNGFFMPFAPPDDLLENH